MNQHFSCNNTTQSPPNNLSCVSQPSNPPNPYAQFFEVAFGSSIYMIVVAFITVMANSLLLLVFYVDPFKTFRNPTSYFLIGLTFVDLITGLVQEPIFAFCFLLGYLRHPATKHYCPKLLKFGQILSLTTMNASFIIVFAFTATQLIVITSPLKSATLVTTTKIIIVILMIYGYTIAFSLLHLFEFSDAEILGKVDLFLHSFFVVYVTLAIYTLLYNSFRRKMIFSRSLRRESNIQGNEGRQWSKHVERKFVTVNFLLVSLVFFCTQPSTILALLKYYWFGTDDPSTLIPSLMVDNILYLKFMLDPFVYAWRLPKYRRALKMVLCCGSRKTNDGRVSTMNASISAQMNRTHEAVILKHFRVVTD